MAVMEVRAGRREAQKTCDTEARDDKGVNIAHTDGGGPSQGDDVASVPTSQWPCENIGPKISHPGEGWASSTILKTDVWSNDEYLKTEDCTSESDKKFPPDVTR